jgi:hypothetical protein
MATDPETVRRDFARTNSNYWKNLTAEDIPSGWIDDMVKRLFDELSRQMLRFENTGSTAPIGEGNEPTQNKKACNRDDLTPAQREQDARTLARLEGTLNRLSKLEMQRASLRATKTTRGRTETRGSILSEIMAGSGTGGTSPKIGADR